MHQTPPQVNRAAGVMGAGAQAAFGLTTAPQTTAGPCYP
jgi:hypothetical protein